MNLFVDTSVWSLALRRDQPVAHGHGHGHGHVAFLSRALDTGESIFTTGLVLQELLQGFAGPRARERIIVRFSALPFLVPDREDHIRAADLRSACRRRGVQVGTIDALLAQLCIRHDLVMLTTDTDFRHIAKIQPLPVWSP